MLCLLLGRLEMAVYRPILMWARVKGTIGFLRRDRTWGKFDRNHRAAAASVGPA